MTRGTGLRGWYSSEYSPSAGLVRFLLSLLCLFALGSSGAPAQSLAPAVPTHILFVGNSFVHGEFEPVVSYNVGVTDENAGLDPSNLRFENPNIKGEPRGHFGGVAAIFKAFTVAAGLNSDVHVELISGKSLKEHYDRALDVIAQPKWDTLVLHDLSTGPILANALGSPENFAKYTKLIEEAVHANNAAAKIWLLRNVSARRYHVPGR